MTTEPELGKDEPILIETVDVLYTFDDESGEIRTLTKMPSPVPQSNGRDLPHQPSISDS